MDALEQYLTGETDDVEVVWANVVAQKPRPARRRPAVARIQRSDGANSRKNAWLLDPSPQPETNGIRKAPPPDAPAPATTTAASSTAAGPPPKKIRPAPATLVAHATAAAEPAGPEIIAIETIPNTLKVIRLLAPTEVATENPAEAAGPSGPTPLRPTGPQPPPDIPVEIEPGHIVRVPHFAVHVARKYKIYGAEGVWTLRFTRVGQLRIARYKPREQPATEGGRDQGHADTP